MAEVTKQLRLDAAEIGAIKVARANAQDIIKMLIDIALHSKSESQRRQAAEQVLKYALADREQQFNVDGKPVVGSSINNISMTKIDLQFNVAMEHLDPLDKIKVAEALDIMERVSAEHQLELIEDVDVLEEVEDLAAPLCKCGCGDRTNLIKSGPKKGQYAQYRQGHHLRKHVASPAVLAARGNAKNLKGKAKA
jgi:hypothetical protein